jgi:hypothetical protein
MIGFLIQFLVLMIVLGALWRISTLLPLPAPFPKISQIVLVLVFALVLINLLLSLVGMGGLWLGARTPLLR